GGCQAPNRTGPSGKLRRRVGPHRFEAFLSKHRKLTYRRRSETPGRHLQMKHSISLLALPRSSGVPDIVENQLEGGYGQVLHLQGRIKTLIGQFDAITTQTVDLPFIDVRLPKLEPA